MSMMSVTVAAAMGAVVAAPMFQLTVAQAQSRAQLEARVLWQSEIERARQLWSLNYEDFDLVELSNSTKCVKGPLHAYNDEGFVFDVKCTVGKQTVGKKHHLAALSGSFKKPWTVL